MIELTNGQKIVINQLAVSPLKKIFYWTGGTLLAVYYFHHRLSYDLDFFSQEPFSFEVLQEFSLKIKKAGNFSDVSSKKIFDRYEFIFVNKETLRVEFVWYNHEKKILKPRKKFMGINIDSLEDIAANKTLALIDRNEAKDIFDLYFILTKGKLSVKKILSLFKEKFGLTITESTFLGECFRALPKLNKMAPYLPYSLSKKEKIIKEIEDFFKEKNREFLSRMWE